MRIYVDTNIYLDYLLEREHSEAAFQLFKRAIKCEFEIIITSKIMDELLGNISINDIAFLMKFLKPKLIYIKIPEKTIVNFKKRYNHYQDKLHAHVAQNQNANLIITRNIKHFSSNSIKTDLPENL